MATEGSESKVPTVPDDPRAVEKFKEYLRVRTVHPTPDYGAAMVFLEEYAKELGLEWEVMEFMAGKPLGLMTWAGTDPSLPSIVLNSHTDVVPVEMDKWTVDPWKAEEIDGKIYGRGTQDMKSVGIQHLEAVRRLKDSGYKPTRTIHLLFVPDEEVGGAGMRGLVESPRLKDLNIGLVLDEGLASTSDTYTVFFGERKIWWIRVVATGPTGHGSRFVKNSSTEKLMRVINKVYEFRKEQEEELEAGAGCGKQLGDVTTMNLSGLEAGIKTGDGAWACNVVPSEAEAAFDCRVPATVDLTLFKAKLDEWTSEDGVSYELIAGSAYNALINPVTELTEDNKWWGAFQEAIAKAGLKTSTGIFPAASDSRFLRAVGIPCLGFSPMVHTPILLHDHDEYLARDVFVHGIGVFETMIPILADAKV